MIKGIGRQPIKDEFANINLGDLRLSHRLIRLAELMDSEAAANIPQSCADWKDIKAAYRFFSNPHVNPEKIQSTHISNVISRINELQSGSFVLVQDTTSISYQSHPATKNLGMIGYKKTGRSRGIQCHTGMIYTIHGTPLGIVFQKFWLRKCRIGKASFKHKRKKVRIPIKLKESIRWLQVIETAHAIQQQVGKAITVVQDREGDINEGFRLALDLKVKFITRLKNDRKCIESGKGSIRKYLKNSQFLGEIRTDITSREKLSTNRKINRRSPPKHRKTSIRIWWKELTIQVGSRYQKDLRKVTVVLADEEWRPGIQKKDLLSWILCTNEAVSTQDQALDIINQYLCRWQIEEYHRIYKTGCNIEDCRLSDSQRLIRFLKLMGIIAWRQHYLTEIGREFPLVPASTILSSAEIQALNLLNHRDQNSDLNLGEAWRLIAKLGGFMNRKSDKNPGPTTLWRGLKKIIYLAQGIEEGQRIAKQSPSDLLKAA